MERSDTHHDPNDGDGFREALNPSYDLLPDGLFEMPDGLFPKLSILRLGRERKLSAVRLAMEHGAKARRAAKCNPPSLLRYNRYAALTRPTNLPDGQISKNLSSPLCKNISVFQK